jgi:malonyl-CoA O-methyltransferase
MIQVARARIRNEADRRVTFVVADAEAMNLDDTSFDLIVSSASVQWFNNPVSTTQRLQRSLTADGTFAFATFGPDTFCELHRSFECAAQRLGHPPLRRGPTYLSAQDWSDCGHAIGQTVRVVDERRVLSFSSVRSFLESVRSLGAANASASVSSYAGKSMFQVMEGIYRESFSSGDRVLATYHILYVLLGRDVPASQSLAAQRRAISI